MGLFSKIKKAFKKIADVVIPIKTIVKVTQRAVAQVMRAVAEIEGLVYNAAKDLTEAISFGPSWLKSLSSKVTNAVFDSLMMSSRLKLGLGLMALGAISNNNALKTEGRLELLTAALYFNRLSGVLPQWLLMIVMIVLSMFFPYVMLIVAAVMIALMFLMKWQLPKLADDPDAMIRHLLMLRRYGLLNDEMAAMIDMYEDRIKRPDLSNETNFGGFEGGYNFEEIVLDPYINVIRDLLAQKDAEFQGDFKPGDLTVPAANQKSGGDMSVIIPVLLAVTALFALSRS